MSGFWHSMRLVIPHCPCSVAGETKLSRASEDLVLAFRLVSSQILPRESDGAVQCKQKRGVVVN